MAKIINDNGLDIDDRAFTILKAMIEDEKNNQLFHLKTLSGETFETSSGHFKLNLEEFTPKEKAYWKKSFEKLVYNNLIQDIGYKGEIFEVTADGYEFYDSQKNNQFVAQVI